MRFKKTLCSLIAIAGLALAPLKASEAGPTMKSPAASTPVQTKTGIRSTKPPVDISDKIKKLVLKDPKDVGKETREYSVNMAWVYADRWYQGMNVEASNSSRRLWLTVGIYASDRFSITEKKVDSTDIVSIVFEGDLIDKHSRKNILLNAQVNYTVVRYTLNPTYKRIFQIEAELRLGAGLNMKLEADEHSYVAREDGQENQILPSLPELSTSANLAFSATPVIKVGPASVRYSVQVDTSGELQQLFGVGVRF